MSIDAKEDVKMKCDELEAEQWLDYSGEPNPCYPQKEVDSAIDELKREHHRELDEYTDWVNKLQRENSELKDMVTTDNSTVIARLKDELRKTQRALWLARAERASDRARIFYFCDLDEKLDIDGFSYDRKKKKCCKKMAARLWRITWLKIERKCRIKAEEYE